MNTALFTEKSLNDHFLPKCTVELLVLISWNIIILEEKLHCRKCCFYTRESFHSFSHLFAPLRVCNGGFGIPIHDISSHNMKKAQFQRKFCSHNYFLSTQYMPLSWPILILTSISSMTYSSHIVKMVCVV